MTEDVSWSGTTECAGKVRVCAVIVTYNIGEGIQKCFDSIRGQVSPIIIVDNGSDDRTRRELRKLASAGCAELILNDRNEGIARALNQGVQWGLSKGFQWFLTLDHDSEATAGLVSRLVEAYAALERRGFHKVGLVTANPFDRNGQIFLEGYPPRENDERLIELERCSSSGCLISRQTFDSVGFFDEKLFVYYVDEDFCFRLRQNGLKMFLCPPAVLIHSEGQKTRQRLLGRTIIYDNYGSEARYYIARNAVHMFKRYWARRQWRELYLLLRRFTHDLLFVLACDRARFRKARFMFRGVWEGIRGKYGRMEP
jgi:rhamnosyltransferase